MNPELNTNIVTDSKQGQIKAVLFLLQSFIDEFRKEVDDSYALLKVDVMTDFSKKIEKSIKNHPFENFFTLSKNIDETVQGIIDNFVKSFLKTKESIINHAFKCNANFNELNYAISLKEDNIENRDAIFDFLDKYDLYKISEKYPISFHFVPTELISKIKSIEEIKFE